MRLLQLVEPLQGVPQLRRALEIELPARREHALPQPRAHVERLALEEEHHVLDHTAIIVLALVADAWRAAALDVVVEARTVGSLARQVPVAGAHREDSPDDLQGLAQGADVGVGPEVAGTLDAHAPDHEHARERLAQRHGDVRVALVVREADVEAGLVLLDEVVLEQQGLGLVRNDDRLEVGDLANQRRVVGAVRVIRSEVARHPLAQALRLPDVEHFARGVLPEVDAGLVGKGL